MNLCYQLLRLLRSMRYGDLLTLAIGVLGFLLFVRRWKR